MLMQKFLQASQGLGEDPEARRLFTSTVTEHSQDKQVFDLLAELQAHGARTPSEQSQVQGGGDVAADVGNVIWPHSCDRSSVTNNHTGREAHVASPLASPSCRDLSGDNVHREDYQVGLSVEAAGSSTVCAEAQESRFLLPGSWRSPQQRQGYC